MTDEQVSTTQRVTDEQVDHPAHYGGADSPYETIKVIEAWGLGFHLGNAVKYISRAGWKTGAPEEVDLRKAAWYLRRFMESGLRDPEGFVAMAYAAVLARITELEKA